MSYVVDFGGRYEPLNYLLRLRGTPSGIIDLAGNTITNNNVDYTSTPSTLGGGTALKFNGTNAYLEINPIYNLNDNEDFTFSAKVYEQDLSRSSSVNSFVCYKVNVVNSNITSVPPALYVGVYSDRAEIFVQTMFSTTDHSARYSFPYNSINTSTGPYHIAVIRHNNVIRVAINGKFIADSWSSGAYRSIMKIGTPFVFGYCGGTIETYKYAKFIVDDICIVDKALWVSSFKPPTKYLPDTWLVE